MGSSAGLVSSNLRSSFSSTRIEVKYGEGYWTLDEPQDDGPWTFSIQKSDSFRIGIFNVTTTRRFESFLILGGQRQETVRLPTDFTVTFDAVGFSLNLLHVSAVDMPGRFGSSQPLYHTLPGWR